MTANERSIHLYKQETYMNTDTLRILLVEDDEDDYLIINNTLSEIRRQAYVLSWEETYEGAVAALHKDSYDVCLVDYRLGSRTGLEFLEQIKAENSAVPVIILTGHEEFDIDMAAMKKGAADFLSKEQIGASLLERSIRYSIERAQYENALIEARDSLEETVRKRTLALEAANRSLEKEIAEKKRAETAIVQAKIEWERTFDAISDLIAVIDGDQRIVRCNRSLTKNLGMEYHEIIGQPCNRCFQFRDHHFLSSNEIDFQYLEIEHSMEFYSEPLGGSYILNSSPVQGPDGEAIGAVLVARNITERKRSEAERERLILELQHALGEVKTLSGLLPICAACKKIRDDKGYWNQIETYIASHSDADFTHSICPDCMKDLYPDLIRNS